MTPEEKKIMETSKINYEELLGLFCDPNLGREELRQPFKQGDKYFATDGFAMVFMPCDIIELPFQEQAKPDCSKFLSQEKTMNIAINVSELERQLIPEMIEEEFEEEVEENCKECDGSGEVEWEYSEHTMEADCPECDGSGSFDKTKITKTGKMITNRNKEFLMCDIGFKYSNLERLVKAAKILGAEVITITAGTATTGVVFELGNDIAAMIMPCIIHDHEREGVAKINFNA